MLQLSRLCCLVTAMTILQSVFGTDLRLSRRDIDISTITEYRAAILLIDGSQTSCEAALMDSSAAFVAASCLQYTDGNLDMSKNYEVAVKMGSGSTNSQRYSISKIDVHPSYNATTFINNLAVVQFNTDSAIDWQTYIGVNPDEWDNRYFARRSLVDTSNLAWNNIIAFSTTTTPSDCAKASKTYNENKGDFLCNYAASLSTVNRDCKMPYGVVYGIVQPDDSGIIAIHSHTSIYGDSLCSSDKKLHYYTLLRNYIAWAARVIGRSVGGFTIDTSYTMPLNYNYSMTNVPSDSVSGVKVFSGNRYAQDPVNPALAEAIKSYPAKSTAVSTSNTTTLVKITSAAAITSPTAASLTTTPAVQEIGATTTNDSSTTAFPASNAASITVGSLESSNSNTLVASSSLSSSPSKSESEDSAGNSASSPTGAQSSLSSKGISDDDENIATELIESTNSTQKTSTGNASSSSTSKAGNFAIGPSESENAVLNPSQSASDDSGSSANVITNKTSENNEEAPGSTRTIIIAVAAVALLGAVGGGIWFFYRRRKLNRELEHESIIDKNGWNSERNSLGSNYLRPPGATTGQYQPGLMQNDRISGFSQNDGNYHGNNGYNDQRVDSGNNYGPGKYGKAPNTGYDNYEDYPYIQNHSSGNINNVYAQDIGQSSNYHTDMWAQQSRYESGYGQNY
ncbi:hypothetical protein BX661DRAFT_55036 [Kickxella alabastrina]|uniref:uncharacterized protein n=1 Tax=Kickxella alabastrina TaxID=61397 RepID=UPI00221ED23E|nr:uncharacterized protein BX661DRAFT_55036 [Kickxella alabastrina]KAI7823735.1 hypothetical protein BX661DRAFT_55036 [Kickxella alabastrina]